MGLSILRRLHFLRIGYSFIQPEYSDQLQQIYYQEKIYSVFHIAVLSTESITFFWAFFPLVQDLAWGQGLRLVIVYLLCVCVCVWVPSCFSRVWLFVTLWMVACQTFLSKEFSRQENWSGLPCPPPGDLPQSGIKPMVFCISCTGRWVLYH